jgi:hypothetical protein
MRRLESRAELKLRYSIRRSGVTVSSAVAMLAEILLKMSSKLLAET